MKKLWINWLPIIVLLFGGNAIYCKSSSNITTAPTASVISPIPVVIHIYTTQNLSPNLIASHLNDINNIFANTYSCDEQLSIPSNTISFCLAQRDNYGNQSAGVYFRSSTFSTFNSCDDELALKMTPRMMDDPYPTSDYLNVYLVDDICAPCKDYGCVAGGFATLPSSHGNKLDGIVLEINSWIGDCNDKKSIVHEVGHYLGLYHTFEGGCKNNNCLQDGDKVCDTPPQLLTIITNNHECLSGTPTNTCTSDVNTSDSNNPFATDQNDPDDNIMNYIPLECQTSLTPGQVDRMEMILCNERKSLLESKGCLEPCEEELIFTIDFPENVIIGNTVDFINNSSNLFNYTWLVNNENISSQDLNYIFDQTGTFEIILSAENGNPSCSKDTTITITISCQEEFIIESTVNQVSVNEVIDLTITGGNINSVYTWYHADTIIGFGVDLTFIPTVEGNYTFYSESCIADCCEQSNFIHILVGDCPPDNEGDLWIFGREGIVLNWETGEPVDEPNVFFGDFSTDFNSDEPSTIQLDNNHDILFYSNGDGVWNKDHVRMPNGNTIGSRSACQTLSLRQPGSSHIYYIFTPQGIGIDLQDDSLKTIYYSIIDLELDGGLGDITTKNVKLLDHGPEYISAVRHCNGVDWWIVTHSCGTNEFYSYLLDKDGLHSVPIISNIGSVHAFYSGTLGFIKFSHDGRLLATTSKSLPSFDDVSGFFEIFEFNNATGHIENLLFSDPNFADPYGIEFSPDNSKIYVTDTKFGLLNNRFFQYDLSVLQQDSIMSSKYSFPWITENDIGALQLGKDGKIYMAYWQFFQSTMNLHVIQKPNLPAPFCEFQYAGHQLANGQPSLGLPNFPGRVYRQEYPEIDGPKTIDICNTSQGIYYAFGRCTTEDYTWNLLGKNKLLINVGDSIRIEFIEKSIDTLLLTRNTACGSYTDSLIINVDDCEKICEIAFDWIENDTLICMGENTSLIYSTNHEVRINGIQQNQFDNKIELYGLVSDTCFIIQIYEDIECDSIFEVCIHVDIPLEINFEDSLSVCNGQSAVIAFSGDADIVELWNLENNTIIFPFNNGFITDSIFEDSDFLIRAAREQGGCDSYFPIRVYLDENVYSEYDTVQICDGDSIEINNLWIKTEGNFMYDLKTVTGCDSLYVLNVNFYPPVDYDNTVIQVCTSAEVDTQLVEQMSSSGCRYFDSIFYQLIEIDTTFQNEQVCLKSEVGSDTIIQSSIDGCDSVIIRQFDYQFDSTSQFTRLNIQLCQDSILIVDTLVIDSAGEYQFSTPSSLECDSIIELIVTYYDAIGVDTNYFSVCDISLADTINITETSLEGCMYERVEIFEYRQPDTTKIGDVTCDSLLIIDTLLLQNIYECDSIVLIEYNHVNSPIIVQFDTLYSEGEIVNITIENQHLFQEVNWTIDDQILCQECYSYSFTASNSIILFLEALTIEGCFKTLEIPIKVSTKEIILPNIFSPNNDGINDFFNPKTSLFSDYNTVDFFIYDRWGNQVFSSQEGLLNGWDGTINSKPCAPGIYVYKIHYTDHENNEKRIFGDLLLVR